MADIVGFTFDEVYPKLLRYIRDNGMTVKPRGIETVEVSPTVFQLVNPEYGMLTIPERGANYYFMLMECVWMLLGSDDTHIIGFFNKNISQFSDDGITMSGAYGPKIVGQIEYVINTLEKDPDSRQALMTIWRENPGPSKDIPCTIMFHFLVRDGCLNMIIYMRSNDLWLGTPYDVFNFTTIQKLLASRLNLKVGVYTHVAGSLHLYKKDFDKIETVASISALKDFPRPVAFNVDHMINDKLSIFDTEGRRWFSDTLKQEMELSKEKNPDRCERRISELKLTPFWSTVLHLPYARRHKEPVIAGMTFERLQQLATSARKKNLGTKS